jgi:hypothetical protein
MPQVGNAPRKPLEDKLLEEFRFGVEAAAMEVALRIASEYAQEGIYAFALCLDEDYKRLSVTVLTEASLHETAAVRWARPRFKRIWPSAEALATSLRWNHWDLPHHKALSKSPELKPAQRLLNKLWKAADIQTSDDYVELEGIVRVALAQAVHAVNKHGVLPGRVVFNVWADRQDTELSLRISEILNTPDTHQWYGATLAAAEQARARDYAAMLVDFRATLEEVAVRAASAAVEQYESEEIYCFALYSSSSLEYVFPTLLTEAGLSEVAAGYRTTRHGKEDVSDLDFRSMLRWSPCDSPRHESLADVKGIDKANKLLGSFWKSVDTASDEAFVDAENAVHDAMVQVLLVVRERGIFQGRVALNVLKGDQSDEEKRAFSRRLNADDIHDWFESSKNAGNRVYGEWIERIIASRDASDAED